MEKPLQIKGLKKLDYPKLYAAVEKNMIAYNLTKIRVIVVKSGVNAFACSLFGDYLIVTKKLIEIMNDNEIEAIIAHEFSHIFNRDSVVMFTIYIIFSIPLIYIYNQINPNSISLGHGIFIIIAFIIFLYGIKVINWVSVRIEIRADREAILKTSNPEAMKNALFKFYLEPFTRTKRPNILEKISYTFEYLSGYFYGFTHPGPKERIEYIELAKKMLEKQRLQYTVAQEIKR